jgi:membrane associated rhomboid family serine protease
VDASDNSGGPDETWVEVGRFPNGRSASEHALVLVASGIDCQLASRGNGVAVLVAPPDVALARHELSAYAEENRPEPNLPLRRYPLADAITGILACWCLLVFIYAAASRNAFGLDWMTAGEGQAGLTVHGQWWRVVTALGLHGDLGHIASNLAAGSLFGLFLAEILGSGPAWLMILIAGAAGNAINSLIQPASHTSIGASTAIFGAVGLLSVLAVRYRPRRAWGLRRWAPVAAGIMLLAFLGVEGPRIDVGAHVAGFAAGCALGAALLAIGPPAISPRLSAASAAVAFAIFAGAWVIALIHG